MIEQQNKKTLLDFEIPLQDLYDQIDQLKRLAQENQVDLTDEIKKIEERSTQLKEKIYSHLTPNQIVQIAKHPERPTTLDYIEKIFDEFIEIKGDRYFADDPAMVGGFARLQGKSVVVMGQQKGRTTKLRLFRNFGMANPEGYRKALRLMRQAEKYNKPIVCFIDTPGAYPGIGAEERGQAEAIAHNLRDMFTLHVPIIVIIIGEGASGGALGIGIGDKVAMMEYTWYGVISPEGCASILWKDSSKSALAAETMRITAPELKEMGVIDDVINEPPGGAHTDIDTAAAALKKYITQSIDDLRALSPDRLIENRYQKFRKMGFVKEE